jgi:hypothetical protein
MISTIEVKERVVDWLNGLAANCYEGIKPMQHLDKWGLHRKIYIVYSSDIKIVWMNKVFFL